MSTYIEDKFECIAKMQGEGDYYNRWNAIRSIWAPRLDKGPISQKEDYTPHNHSDHNVGIYKILSDVLIPNQAYGHEINVENLFILNVAVLLHDLMMTYVPSARSEHARAARDYILTKFREEDFNIKAAEREAIADVILGHTDIKDSSGNIAIEVFDLLPQNFEDCPTGILGKINTPLLSALLRLADELDIHTGRIDSFHHQRREIKSTSKPHWRKCEILKYPEKKSGDVTVIQLIPNSSTILMDGNLDNDVPLLIEVRNKILKELKNLNAKVFNKGYLSTWRYLNIEIKAEGEILQKIKHIDAKGVNPFSADSEKIIDIEAAEPTESIQIDTERAKTETTFSLAPEEIQDKISQWVSAKGLLKSGHFKVDDDFRVRDWIDSQGLLDDGKCLDYICNAFSDRLNLDNSKYFFIGVDHYGLLISSILGLKLNSPFSYIISKRLSSVHIDKEKEIVIPEDHKIILITDVIITFSTIISCIEYIKMTNNINNERIENILTIFFRPQTDHGEDNGASLLSNWANKLYALNKSFPVERCNKNTCLFLQKGIDLYSNIPKDI
jgi:orotate phosphoribosyltransferase